MNNKNQLRNLYEVIEKDNNLRFTETKVLFFSKKYDVIFDAVLFNVNKKSIFSETWGKPDIIVSGKWINVYYPNLKIDIPNDRSKYYIIDIKSSSIKLINSLEDLSESSKYNGYKSQILVYKNALDSCFKDINIDNSSSFGFILGKNYQGIIDKVNYYNTDPFSMLAVINFDKSKINGEEINKEVSRSINWNKFLMNKRNYNSLSLFPINNSELYPNMKNTTSKYYNLKKKVANANKEITLMYYCGTNKRNSLHNKGIYSFTDPKCDSETLGFKKNQIMD